MGSTKAQNQTILCNGTSIYVAQPPDYYTDSTDLCGFASCLIPNASDLQDCCLTPLQSNGLYRYCEPRQNSTNWKELSDYWYNCASQSPVANDWDGSYGIGCNRVPNGAATMTGVDMSALCTVVGLLVTMLYYSK